jgi:hypothetical protein
MMTRSKKSNRYVRWPPGWELEAERLAKLYLRTAEDADKYDEDLKSNRRARRELKLLGGISDQLAQGLRALLKREAADQLIQLFYAHADRTAVEAEHRNGLDRLLAYERYLEKFALQVTEFANDIERAARLLEAEPPVKRGNQSTLVLRFTIAAAAAAYAKLFRRRPGRSRSDYGPFGKFVLEIIKRVPLERRPQRPSASTINAVVRQWERWQVVA